MLAPGKQIAGAAQATMLSNLVALSYHLLRLLRKKGRTAIALHPKFVTLSKGIPREVLLTGLPSALVRLMGTVSNVTLNHLMSAYSNEAIAGVGIAYKVDRLTFGIAVGMTQGVVPLIGCNYSSGNLPRMKAGRQTPLEPGRSGCRRRAVHLRPAHRARLHRQRRRRNFQPEVSAHHPHHRALHRGDADHQHRVPGRRQEGAADDAVPAPKGRLDVPFLFLMNAKPGVNGIVRATPIEYFGAMVIALLLLVPFWHRLQSAPNL